LRILAAGAALFGIVLASACGGSGSSAASGGSSGLPPLTPAKKGNRFTHIVILIQENRTFDNLFATFPGADGAATGKTHAGSVPLEKSDLESRVSPNNLSQYFLADLNGGAMNGFDRDPSGGAPVTNVYQYVDPAQIQPYWALAKQYVLADRMFQTQGSGSFTAHQDLIAGGTAIDPTHSLVDFPNAKPWGCDAPPGTATSLVTQNDEYLPGAGPFPCLSYRTLRDLLDGAGLSWRYYTPEIGPSTGGALWSAFDAVDAVRHGPEWGTNVTWPEKLVFTDIARNTLPDVAWVIPDFENSDHAGSTSDSGPSWVAQVVNAIGRSPAWKSTAIVIVWDDWGGWYDHVVPPKPYTFGGLGFRVPMIVVSSRAKAGYVSHNQYEFGSIVRFVEDNWSLGQLGTTDLRASNFIDDMFDFSRPPRPFVPIEAKYSRAYFDRQRPSNQPVDDE
jgi:phospholipase C